MKHTLLLAVFLLSSYVTIGQTYSFNEARKMALKLAIQVKKNTLVFNGESTLISGMMPANNSVENSNTDPALPYLIKTPIRKIVYQNHLPLPIRIKVIPKTVYSKDLFTLEASTELFKEKKSKKKKSSAPKKYLTIALPNLPVERLITINTEPSNRYDELPIRIKEISRTTYRHDQEIGDKLNKQKVVNSKNVTKSIKVATTKQKSTSKVTKQVITKRIAVQQPQSIYSKKMFKTLYSKDTASKLPLKIKEVPKAIYYADHIESALLAEAKVRGQKRDTKLPINKPKKTSIITPEESFNTKEIKGIVKRVKENEENISEPVILEERKVVATNQTKVQIFREPELIESIEAKSREDEVYTSSTRINNSAIVTSQPLEVTSQVIKGRSVITEIKPVKDNSTLRTSTTATVSSLPSYKMHATRRSTRAFQFAQNTIDGENISVANMKGKVVVMNFWFTTCMECIREMPDLNELKDRYEGREIEFVSICIDDPAKIRNFVQKHPFNYKHIPNAKFIAEEYFMFLYPGHAVIDKDGGLMNLLTGNGPDIMNQLELTIKQGLSEVF